MSTVSAISRVQPIFVGPKSNIHLVVAPLESVTVKTGALIIALILLMDLPTAQLTAVTTPKPLIAIVDDDESVCRALRRLVRSLAMDTETFGSGQDFLELLDAMPSFQPDCLILDVQMPVMNGLEVQNRLTQSGVTIPVIFVTAHDEVGIREKALAAGAVAFLRKPFNDELLIKTLREALKRGGAQPTGA